MNWLICNVSRQVRGSTSTYKVNAKRKDVAGLGGCSGYKGYIQASEDKNDVPKGSGQSAGAFEAKVGGAIIDLVHYKEKLKPLVHL